MIQHPTNAAPVHRGAGAHDVPAADVGIREHTCHSLHVSLWPPGFLLTRVPWKHAKATVCCWKLHPFEGLLRGAISESPACALQAGSVRRCWPWHWDLRGSQESRYPSGPPSQPPVLGCCADLTLRSCALPLKTRLTGGCLRQGCDWSPCLPSSARVTPAVCCGRPTRAQDQVGTCCSPPGA